MKVLLFNKKTVFFSIFYFLFSQLNEEKKQIIGVWSIVKHQDNMLYFKKEKLVNKNKAWYFFKEKGVLEINKINLYFDNPSEEILKLKKGFWKLKSRKLFITYGKSNKKEHWDLVQINANQMIIRKQNEKK